MNRLSQTNCFGIEQMLSLIDQLPDDYDPIDPHFEELDRQFAEIRFPFSNNE